MTVSANGDYGFAAVPSREDTFPERPKQLCEPDCREHWKQPRIERLLPAPTVPAWEMDLQGTQERASLSVDPKPNIRSGFNSLHRLLYLQASNMSEARGSFGSI